MSGALSYHAGRVAEDRVADHYTRAGMAVLARRWRGQGGEIDLIIGNGAALIFVEVKKSRSFARAAERISPRQMARIHATASEFLATQPNGQLTEARFDVALMDGTGQLEMLENAFTA